MGRPLLALAMVLTMLPLSVSASAVTRNVDESGKHTSVVIGPDGYPIVAYYYFGQGLKVADCADSACTPAHASLTTVGEARDGPVDMTLGPDGNPIIVYATPSDGYLRLVKCGNTRCTPELATSVTLRQWWTPDAAITLGGDGFPFIAAATRDPNTSDRHLWAIDCSNLTCSQGTQHRVSLHTPGGLDVAIGTDGYPRITFSDGVARRLVRCGDPGCTAAGATVTDIDPATMDSGGNTGLMIKDDGNPVIVYRGSDVGEAWVRLADCTDPDCTSPTIADLDSISTSSNAGEHVSVTPDANGNPIVAYYRSISGNLRLAECANTSCTNRTTTDLTGSGGWFASLAISYEGHPVVSYQGVGGVLNVVDTGPLTGPDGSITGVILDEFGEPTPEGWAEVFTLDEFMGAFPTDGTGRYDTGALSAGSYFVFLYNGNVITFIDWFPEWYPNRPHLRPELAKPVVIEHLGGPVTGIDAQLEPLFIDMFGTVFTNDIGWLRGTGITKGCSTYLFCTDDSVTRGQMAAFLTRGLSLVDDGGGNLFEDDDGSTFERDIDRLATAGITKGCNPPRNNWFCPEDPVIRGAMAAFLVRALGYSDDGGGDLFEDDNNSIFERDIDRLATAGVTKGCNPPDNTEFCPDDPVTRGAMAAFLHRALGGGLFFPASAQATDDAAGLELPVRRFAQS